MIDFTSSLRSKKFILYEVVEIWSGIGLKIYILYISIMSLRRLWTKFVYKNLRGDYFQKSKKQILPYKKVVSAINNKSKLYDVITS